jgi:hypothetical protein
MDAAKEAIQRLMNEYCYRIDQGDLDGFSELFEHASFGVIGDPDGPCTGSEEVREFLQKVILYDGIPHTKHVLSNVQIDVAINNCEATAQSYVTVFQALPDFPMQAIFCGHYHDRFIKRESGWCFAKREISADLLGDLSQHRSDMA